jgi:hypothetical protein
MRELLLKDVSLVFEGVNAGNASEVLDSLNNLSEIIFRQFTLQQNVRGWIDERWEAGPKYNYEGFPIQAPIFSSENEPALTPLPIRLSNANHLEGAFHYLFTSKGGHWNCSNRSGGYKLFPNGHSTGQINTVTESVRTLDQTGVHGIGNVELTKTVLMHLVWPYVFPVWYKETKDGYSQIAGMTRLLSDIDFYSDHTIRKKEHINVRNDYMHYSAVYRILLGLYKKWVLGQGAQPHFDFFTQFLAELVPTVTPIITYD